MALFNKGWSPHSKWLCRSDHHSSLPPVKNTQGKTEQQITPTAAQETTSSKNLVSGGGEGRGGRKRTLRPGFETSKQDADTSAKMSPEALHISCHFASKHRENHSARITSVTGMTHGTKPLQSFTCKGIACKFCFLSITWCTLAKISFWLALPWNRVLSLLCVN